MFEKKLFVTKIDNEKIFAIDDHDFEFVFPRETVSEPLLGDYLLLRLTKENEPLVDENDLAKQVLNEVLKT
ncbi:MAG: hypothetical protein WCT18_02820 [Patescibacteria group bacterium]